jgi:hypothetical protein
MKRARLWIVPLLLVACSSATGNTTQSLDAFPTTTLHAKLPPSSAPLFARISIPGSTDIQEGTNGIALADLNRDGLVDIVATYSPPMGLLQHGNDKLRVFINQGNLTFKEHTPKIADPRYGDAYWRNVKSPI